MKSTKHKETVFIRSDFFDQKVNIVLVPAPNMGLNTGSTTPRDSSLQSSLRASQLQSKKAREQSREVQIRN